VVRRAVVQDNSWLALVTLYPNNKQKCRLNKNRISLAQCFPALATERTRAQRAPRRGTERFSLIAGRQRRWGTRKKQSSMVGICGRPLIEQKIRSMNGAQFYLPWVGVNQTSVSSSAGGKALAFNSRSGGPVNAGTPTSSSPADGAGGSLNSVAHQPSRSTQLPTTST